MTLNGDITVSQSALQCSIQGTLAGAGTVTLGPTARTISEADRAQDVDLVVRAGLTGAGLVKTGAGRLELDPAGGFTWGLNIGTGDVQVDTSAGAVQLIGGSLSGTGTVGAVDSDPVTLAAAVVSPGVAYAADPAGILHSGSDTWNPQTALFMHLANSTSPHAAPVPGTDDDQRQVTGDISLGGARLDGTFGTGIQLGDRFTIITYTGIRTGKFAQTNGRDEVFVGGQKFQIVYDDADKSVVLDKVLADATVALTSSADPSTLNQPVTFTATVTPELGSSLLPITTVVTFSGDGVPQSPAVTVDASDTATFTPGTLTGGNHTVTAHFGGDNFNPADGPDLTQTVEVPTIDPLTAAPPLISPQDSPGVQDALPVSTTVRSERG